MSAAALLEGGCTNSHLTAKNGRPLSAEHGVDTWRLVRYLDDKELAMASSRCTQRVRGGSILSDRLRGHVVGVAPSHRMLFMEGHPAVEGLARPDDLLSAEAELLAALDDAGIPVGTDGGCGRLDTTCTLRFEDPRHGLVFLSGMAALDVPRAKPSTIGRPIETVYWMAEMSGKKLARAYDKGLQAGTAPRGELIRLEAQTRYSKEARRAVEELDPSYVTNRFRNRFAPLAASADGLTAATVPALADELRARVDGGELRYQAAERMAGYLVLGGEQMRGTARTKRRRRAELRRHGLVLADPLKDPIHVDLTDGLDAALAAWEGE